ncbi:hypothetical protein [Tissierella sp. Yu-01]|jgi:hypothetical protein|uniref:hypothetical protein n=1 Tax=Tissierella sp. Yu-01 TaxID=3035694 RepID=UPI00240E5B79|nr:hypothetical protein [Tissierella sp. Yu-01]WFA09179.1 hypothetical protein P3962_01000 [Tissierella sp. Yu-01]
MKLKNRDGSVLAFVLVILSVFTIFAMSALHITLTNTKQVTLQQNSIQAYYFAYSGAEIAYAALLKSDNNGKSILDTFQDGNIDMGPDEIDIDGDGTDDVKVVVNYDSKKKSVLITSTGIDNSSDKSTTLKMSFNVDYPTVKLWE